MRASLLVRTSIVLLFATTLLAQEQLPKTLAALSARKTSIPVFGFVGQPQCNTQGDYFFLLENEAGSPPDVSVLKVSNSDAPTLFRPKDPEAGFVFAAFSAPPNGGAPPLMQQSDSGVTVTTFDSAGNQLRRILLATPAGLEAREFAVLSNERYFVGGFFTDTVAEPLRYSTYGAIFDGSGKLVVPISSVSLKSTIDNLQRPHDSAVAVSNDGKLYVAREGRLIIVDSAGKRLRELTIERPEPGAVIMGIEPADEILLHFVRFSGAIHSYLVTLDPSSGRATHVYRPPMETEGTPVCFKGAYTFLSKPQDGKVTFVSAR